MTTEHQLDSSSSINITGRQDELSGSVTSCSPVEQQLGAATSTPTRWHPWSVNTSGEQGGSVSSSIQDQQQLRLTAGTPARLQLDSRKSH